MPVNGRWDLIRLLIRYFLPTVTVASTNNALPDDGVCDCVETCRSCFNVNFNPLNAKLYPTCHLLALLGAHHILHVSRIRVNVNFKVVFKTIQLCISW
jgi:hypothetical protein